MEFPAKNPNFANSLIYFVTYMLLIRRYMSTTTGAGIVKNLISKRIADELKPLHFVIEDESHRHSRGGESHFKVLVVSQLFEDKSLLERHRIVNAAATGNDLSLPCHALSISAKTPSQWADGEVRLQSTPSCLGGDK